MKDAALSLILLYFMLLRHPVIEKSWDNFSLLPTIQDLDWLLTVFEPRPLVIAFELLRVEAADPSIKLLLRRVELVVEVSNALE